MIETIYFILFCFIIYICINYSNDNVIYITINNENFLVRNLNDKIKAAETLYNLKNQLILLIDNIYNENNENYENYENYENNNYNNYVRKIKNRLKTVKIRESSPNSTYTSYTVNKGEEMVYCIRSKEDNNIHDMNELLYVAIHEIAHIGCPEVGHTELFKKINIYLLNKAIYYNIYNYKNYYNNNIEYCGMKISSNILG
jgi:hypothetical protein